MNLEIQQLSMGNISLKRILMFTDIHFGARNNGIQHNQDCLNYLDWFVDLAKKEKADAIVFLGDYFENRNSINVLTHKYAIQGLRKLEELNVPIFFIIGNHDLYHRHTRDVHSLEIFKGREHFILIEHPVSVDKKLLFCPYLFKDEYPAMVPYVAKHRYIFGHFEFRNFVLTGSNTIAEHGPDHTMFKGCRFLFSGHYHARQTKDNIVYIGNAFPTNYGDVEDTRRGACLLDLEEDDYKFFDWSDCPSFHKTTLTKVINEEWVPRKNGRVRCLIDIEISYSEVQQLREGLLEMYGLREFSIEENILEKKDAMQEGADVAIGMELTDLDETVRILIKEGVQNTTSISSDKLIEIYNEL
ncbi:MAG: metallophosphoesterase [Candidatus Nitrosotenuis sp.]